MRRRLAMAAVVPLVGGVGLAAPAVAAPVVTAVTTTAAEWYVSAKHCAPGADGSQDAPFCTISAAAAVAGPGHTVLVQPGDYPEAVTLTRSGTQGAPITFRAVNGPDGNVRVGYVAGQVTPGIIFSLVGVHDIRVEGFFAHTPETVPAVLVDGGARVTLDGLAVRAANAPAMVRVTRSSDVTVSRGWFQGATVGLSVDDGTTGAVVTANGFSGTRLRVADAPGTVVTGNTVVTSCTNGIEVTGASPGVSLRNNIVQTAAGAVTAPTACADPATATAIGVSAGSAPGTIVDHNLIDPTSRGALYRWAGVDHATTETFRAATGQGAHDIAAPALIQGRYGGERGWYPLHPASPAVDSADGTAPGATATDVLHHPHADPPETPNTGTGGGYHDRGAVEYVNWAGMTGYDLRRVPGAGPTDVQASMTAGYPFPVDAPAMLSAFKFEDERFWRVTTAPSVRHTYRRAGVVSVTFKFSPTAFRDGPGTHEYRLWTAVGAHYRPVTPTRLLDTRAAVGVPGTTPVPPNSEIVLPVDRIGDTPARDVSAVVLNVTATQPTTAGFLTVFPDGSAAPNASNVNFVPGETVPNLVTVPMGDTGVRIRNSGPGTVHVVADLQGWYGRTGSGFEPVAPTRVLDTRAAGGTAFGAYATRQLDLSRKLPADATAAVLNVTVTAPTRAGVLKVFPAGSATPEASNLNFVAGQTIPNLVVVPVVDGRVSIHNASSGSTHVVADLAGFYASTASGATDAYVPYGPTRIVDTRTDTGLIYRNVHGALEAGEGGIFRPDFLLHNCWECPEPTGAVLNVTVTAPSAPGFLTVYPHATDMPNASHVNFVARETAANLAVVPTGQWRRIVAANRSRGSTHLVVDQAGYFIGPAA
ncbi:DUF1565 domain-containing protein [Micromonospora citrea]|uniref:DUF1565 domain-containing protein n=1 Tax=Micromonospora citrea TaxID=47855 RepID=UPI003C40439B